MTMQTRLELTWLPRSTHSRAEPRLRVQPLDSPAAPPKEDAPVEFVLSVCGAPRCGCTRVQLRSPAAAGVEPQSRVFPSDVWLDLETKSLVRGAGSKADPAFERLDGIIRPQLTDAHRQELREWFFAEKLQLILTTPTAEFDVHDLPEARAGLMIGFVDIFPCGLAFHFTFEGEMWAVDDQFCVQPDCSCSETVLSFLKLVDRSGVPARKIRDIPSLRYNYGTRRTVPFSDWPAAGPSPTDLFGALKAANPKLDEVLQLRQLILQNLYARQEIARNMSRLASLAGPRRPKVGRNDPCPCGSGRKFKHCCLNKPEPAPEFVGGVSL